MGTYSLSRRGVLCKIQTAAVSPDKYKCYAYLLVCVVEQSVPKAIMTVIREMKLAMQT
jgi:hypothetical protein